MKGKALTLAVALAVGTSTAWAAAVPTTVNNSDKLTKFQKEAIQYTQQSLANTVAGENYSKAIKLDATRAVGLALENNRTAKQSKWAYDASRAQVSATAAQKNPTLSYGYSGGKTKVEAGDSTSASNTFTLAVPVFAPKLDAAIDASRYARESAGAAYEEALQQAKYDAVNGYFTLLMDRNKVDVATQSVRDYQGHVDNVQAQYNVGLVASSDVLAAKTKLASAQTDLVTTQNAADIAETNLNIVIGYPVSTKIATVNKDLTYKPYDVVLDQANAYALLHRAALIESAMAVKQAEVSLSSAKSGYLPTIKASVSQEYKGDDWNGTGIDSLTYGASATWNLWDGGATTENIKVAEANLEKAKEANLAAKDSVLLSVQTAYLKLKAAEKTIASTRTAVEEGQESFRIASLRYRAGVGTNLDVLDAETSLTTARNSYVEALYNYNVAIAALEQAVGVPLDTPVGAGATVIAQSGAVETLQQLGTAHK